MKTIFKTIIVGMCISLGFWGSADAQYSVQGNNLQEVLKSLDLFHCGAPDELTNRSSVPITVKIEKANGVRKPGLQKRGNPSSTFNTLPADSTSYEINSNIFRPDSLNPDSSKKIELVLTIPSLKVTDGWENSPVVWSLGKGHESPSTRINFLTPSKGYEIIFIYKKGVQPCLNPGPIHIQSHVDGHICDPNDHFC